MEESDWQSIASAPYGEWVLVYCGPGGIVEAIFCEDFAFAGDVGTMKWLDSYGETVIGATHWMPAPPSPRAEPSKGVGNEASAAPLNQSTAPRSA